jgi:pyruvate, water dikinase
MLHEIRRRGEGADYDFRLRYETLRQVLRKNGKVLQLLNDLEADLNHLSRHDYKIRRPLKRLLAETLLMAQELNLLTHDQYSDLYDIIFNIGSKIDSATKEAWNPKDQPLIVTLDDDDCLNSTLVGGKALGVARLRRLFPDSVPPGFIITTAAYRLFLEENQLMDRIRLLLFNIETVMDQNEFRSRTQTIRDLIRSAYVPKEVSGAIARNASKFTKVVSSGWAVRSSATSEDEHFSFAGQFESLLSVDFHQLADAYRFVLSSRFSDRAVTYRLHCGFCEVDTPMAVLFMPTIDPQATGVIYTTNPQELDSHTMLVNTVPGLGEAFVRGTEKADIFYISREEKPRMIKVHSASGRLEQTNYLSTEKLFEIGSIGYRASRSFGHEMDIEWAMDKQGKMWLLQGRRINIATVEKIKENKSKKSIALAEGGITIFPGRAEGSVVWLSSGTDPSSVPKGSVLVVNQPTPELAVVLPRIAALLATEGNPAGHLAALLREFAVPGIFQLGNQIKRLIFKTVVSVDATNRKIYDGSLWPEVKDIVLSRMASAQREPRSGPLYDLISALSLTDPHTPSFKSKNCRSIHDIIRFIHEMSIRSMFTFGDDQNHLWPKTKRMRRLHTTFPLKLNLIDLDESISDMKKVINPEQIQSIPFQALWRGLSDPGLPWSERWEGQFFNLPSGFREAVLGGGKGPRRPSDDNYVMVAADYMNLNARMAFHYAMIDALVSKGDENNHVHFWFHGGGAADENRTRRARFIEQVLRQLRFGVDRHGDLVSAWLRRYPMAESEKALESIGRLMVCARQLDMLMKNESSTNLYVERFLSGQYQAFA